MILGYPQAADGLSWEIDQVFTQTPPHKIVLLVPPHLPETSVRQRWERYVAITNGRMPEFQAETLMIRFKSDWTPLLTSKPKNHLNHEQIIIQALKEALVSARNYSNIA
jgi:hypothetical protein